MRTERLRLAGALLAALWLSGCAACAPRSHVERHAPGRVSYSLAWGEPNPFAPRGQLVLALGEGVHQVGVEPLEGEAFRVRFADDTGGDYGLRVEPDDHGFLVPAWRTHYWAQSSRAPVVLLARGGRTMYLEGRDLRSWRAGDFGWWSDPASWTNSLEVPALEVDHVH